MSSYLSSTACEILHTYSLSSCVKTASSKEGPALGVALLAATGAGIYSSVPEACKAVVKTDKVQQPEAERVPEYEKYYKLYTEIYPALKAEFAKLAKMFKKEGKRPLLIAADVYRPAAIEQLKVVGERAEVAVFEMGQIDPRKIVKEGIKHAKDYGNDLVIIDTAGRLHIDEELMNELKDIKKIAEPNEIMLVVDAMIGQDAVKVASSFDEALGIDSVILTKLDSDTRGGAALSVLAVTGKPIKFVGMGEKLDEFEAFHPERMASRILGMGDMLTLIEKATQTVDEKDAKKLAEKMQEKGFDLNDLLEQMKQIQKMGSMKSIIRMLPGANKVTDEQVEQGEVQLKKTEAMINSMTRAEREKPAIIDPKRKRRIAAGSGTQVSDVNQLLKQFEQMQKMMKQFGIGGNLHGKKSRRNRAALLKGLGGGMPQ